MYMRNKSACSNCLVKLIDKPSEKNTLPVSGVVSSYAVFVVSLVYVQISHPVSVVAMCRYISEFFAILLFKTCV